MELGSLKQYYEAKRDFLKFWAKDPARAGQTNAQVDKLVNSLPDSTSIFKINLDFELGCLPEELKKNAILEEYFQSAQIHQTEVLEKRNKLATNIRERAALHHDLSIGRREFSNATLWKGYSLRVPRVISYLTPKDIVEMVDKCSDEDRDVGIYSASCSKRAQNGKSGTDTSNSADWREKIFLGIE